MYRTTMDDLFREVFGSVSLPTNIPSNWEDTSNEYTLFVDLPGSSEEYIYVHLQDNVVSIQAERVLGTQSWSRYNQSFRLPKDADSDKLAANYKNGVLSLSVPKLEAAKPRQIQVGKR